MANITDLEAAKIALWLDGPYGDGIRLAAIRDPSLYRIAALEFVASGQRTIDNLEQAYIALGHAKAKDKKIMRVVARNEVLK